jgi:hypothetical protein
MPLPGRRADPVPGSLGSCRLAISDYPAPGLLSQAASRIVAVHAAARRRYTVMIACQPAGRQDLTRAQAAGESCIRCGKPGPGELLPVGVCLPPRCGSGVVTACQGCAVAVLSP